MKKHFTPNTFITPAIFFVFTLLYLFSMPPTVYWQDAGIYLTGIMVEGIVYPPGYPIYMMLAIVWKHIIPITNFSHRIVSLSAVSGGLLSVGVYLIVLRTLNNKFVLFNKNNPFEEDKHNNHNKNNDTQTNEANTKVPRVTILISLITTLTISLNFNIWSQSINAEVYTLYALLLVFIILLILKLGQKGRIDKTNTSNTIQYTILISIVYGISFGIHPMTILLAPVFLYILIAQKNILLNTKTTMLSIGLFGVFATIPYLYLPIVSNTHPALNWGNPTNIQRFLTHVTGKTYVTSEQSFVFNDASRYASALQEFVWEFSISGLVLALYGAFILYKKDKHLSVIFAIIINIYVVFAVFYKQTSEYNAWLIPSHIILTIYIAFAYLSLYTQVVSKIKHPKSIQNMLKSLPLGMLCCIFLIFLITHAISSYQELNRRDYYYAEDFAKNILRNLDKDSLVLMTGDQESSTTMYAQSVLKYRSDVILFKNIETEQLTYFEGREDLRIRYPKLSLDEVVFSSLKSEDSPDIYTDTLISQNIKHKMIYTISKGNMAFDPQKYTLTPASVLWKISNTCAPDQSICVDPEIDLKYWDFYYHDPKFYLKKERPLMSLKDPSKPGGINRVPFIQHMINFELQAWKNLGDWYLDRNQCAKAQKSYQKMKTLNPDIFKKLPQITESLASCKE
ncbi:MAG: DUF2723 domain-containing protein [bacterium]|nr:DUF2723 domain-containing protein [bacterium]